MTTEDILKKLRPISDKNDWDAIYEIGALNNLPVYQLKNSNIPEGAKTGYPHLYCITKGGKVQELSLDQIRAMSVSYDGRRKRLQ